MPRKRPLSEQHPGTGMRTLRNVRGLFFAGQDAELFAVDVALLADFVDARVAASERVSLHVAEAAARLRTAAGIVEAACREART